MNKKVLPYVLFTLLAANIYGQTPQINEALLKKIFMALPDEEMPDVFQTTEKRSRAKPSIRGNILSDDLADYDEKYYVADFILAAFPYDDGKNILLIMQVKYCFDGCELGLDKTLNYHVASGKITSISRPIDPFDADDFLSKADFGDLKPGTKGKMKQWFNESADEYRILYEFTDNGMNVLLRHAGYDDDDKYDYMFWSDYSNPSIKDSKVHYRWDGKRFVKEKEHEYSRITIDSYRTNVNLREQPKTGNVAMQANKGDRFIIQSEPTIKEDDSAWYTICYTIDKDGVITYMPTVLYIAARFAGKKPLEDGDVERMKAAKQRAATTAQ